jgi:hypothetical protein
MKLGRGTSPSRLPKKNQVVQVPAQGKPGLLIGAHHRAPQASRATPYPPATPKVCCVTSPRLGLRGSGLFPPRENPNVTAGPPHPGPRRRLAIRGLCQPLQCPCCCRAGASLCEVTQNGDEAVHLQP